MRKMIFDLRAKELVDFLCFVAVQLSHEDALCNPYALQTVIERYGARHVLKQAEALCNVLAKKYSTIESKLPEAIPFPLQGYFAEIGLYDSSFTCYPLFPFYSLFNCTLTDTPLALVYDVLEYYEGVNRDEPIQGEVPVSYGE